ncbi:MAG: ROK family protein [Calditrichae bacterium]|nr:ROK family protein [Calditrichota bacterium]MCB9057296.1 ROK family protein [Calditrichia bacterium]
MSNILIIGVDGGATKVSAWEVVFDDKKRVFSMGKNHAEKKYSEITGFVANFQPVNIQQQLKERDENNINPNSEEKQQESVYVQACADVIHQVAAASEKSRILVGIGMPGLKTDDKRGIAVVANGPRMINYSDLLERLLRDSNLEMIAPVHHLGSDADYCGIGENYSDQGIFKDCENAYYLGGGTGVADALKLKGQLLPFDATKDWIAKTWEMKSSNGKSLERFCSAGGIQSVYSELSGVEVSELNKRQIYPLQIAALSLDAEDAAVKTMNQLVSNLGDLFISRITTLYSGWNNEFEFMNPNRPALSSTHEYKGMVFEKIILGQRLGDLYISEQGVKSLQEPLIAKIKSWISETNILDMQAKEHYNKIDSIIVTSKLREAPALGAGIDAFFSWQDFQ